MKNKNKNSTPIFNKIKIMENKGKNLTNAHVLRSVVYYNFIKID